jgi:hypothetical protein
MSNKSILRLLLWSDCDRNCIGCCNKQWDLNVLPVCSDYTLYNEILLTGGEPLLNIDKVINVITDIRLQNQCPIYLYTAKIDFVLLRRVLQFVDGITLTLHNQDDADKFILDDVWALPRMWNRSYNLNIFNGIQIKKDIRYLVPEVWGWNVKDNIEWIENCPLPEHEVFMQYSGG